MKTRRAQKQKNFLSTSQIILTIALFLSAFISSLSEAQYFSAPIGYLPDPHVIYHDGWYYYTGTSGGSINLKRAKTLEGLKSTPHRWVFGPSSGGPCCKYWAPELHRVDNKWYIYYTAKQNSTDPQNMWVIENSANNPMEGTWINRGRIFDPSNDYWAIDGTVFQLRGKLYYVYSGVAKASDGDKPQRMYIARMSNPWTLSSARVHLSSPEYAWERHGLVNEGPAMLQANGKTFLVYSGSGCWTANYALGYLWIHDNEDPMNPNAWEKITHAVFSQDASVAAYGPGHNSFFNSPDGKEVWMAYHATPNSAGTCDMSRATSAKKINFDSNGFPIFGSPIPTGTRLTPPSGEPGVATNSTLANGIYKIQASSSTRPLDVSGCSRERGANVHQWQSYNNDCQKWHVQATEDGHYYITSVRGGLTLDVEGCGTDNATNVRMWTPSGKDCQKWDIIPNGDGTYRIASVKSGKVLDIQFGGDNNGANLQIYSYLGNPQQHFHLSLLDRAHVAPKGFAFCANENGRCSVEGVAEVAYGAHGAFNYRTVSGSISCNNGTFGDPIVGPLKKCYYRSVLNKDWTRWYDRDDPSGNEDNEARQTSVCDSPVAIEARVRGTDRVIKPGQVSVDNLAVFNEKDGLICRNNDQTDGSCSDYEVRFLCPTEHLSRWYDKDDPSGTADNESKSSEVCAAPSAVEARIKGSDSIFTPKKNEPETFEVFNSVSGLVCLNRDQSDGRCNDYEVRFLCLNEFWSEWYDRDDASGSGDFESSKSIICSKSIAVEARVIGSDEIFTPGSREPENFREFNATDGLVCLNRDQSDGRCDDYEVRFLCI